MANSESPSLSFIANFVDAVTVRPFMSDLHRVAREAHIFRAMPRDFVNETELEAEATAAA